jgi:hypothetical protein
MVLSEQHAYPTNPLAFAVRIRKIACGSQWHHRYCMLEFITKALNISFAWERIIKHIRACNLFCCPQSIAMMSIAILQRVYNINNLRGEIILSASSIYCCNVMESMRWQWAMYRGSTVAQLCKVSCKLTALLHGLAQERCKGFPACDCH